MVLRPSDDAVALPVGVVMAQIFGRRRVVDVGSDGKLCIFQMRDKMLLRSVRYLAFCDEEDHCCLCAIKIRDNGLCDLASKSDSVLMAFAAAALQTRTTSSWPVTSRSSSGNPSISPTRR